MRGKRVQRHQLTSSKSVLVDNKVRKQHPIQIPHKGIYTSTGKRLASYKNCEIEGVSSNFENLGVQDAPTIKATNMDIGQEKIMSENISHSALKQEYQEEMKVIKEKYLSENQDSTPPKVMDIRTVVKMFKDLKDEIKVLKESKAVSMTSQANIHVRSEEEDQELAQLRQEVRIYKERTDILAGIVERIGVVQHQFDHKLELLENRCSRLSVVISGLQTGKKIIDCIVQIEDFIHNELMIEVVIVYAFKLGIGSEKPVVITLESLYQKTQLFRAMNAYRKSPGQQAPPIYVSDYISAATKEKRRQEFDIYKSNEHDQSSKVNMKIYRNSLTIDGEVYKKKVIEPDSTKVLTYSEEHLNAICEMKLNQGETIHHKGSNFTAFSLPVLDHGAINDAYMKLRLDYPEAKHIVCAYIIPGPTKCYAQNYCDDKEHGAGNAILKLLQDNDILSTAVFVVRVHEGLNIGEIRYECMKKAVKSIFDHAPYNCYLNRNQKIILADAKEDKTKQSLKTRKDIKGFLPQANSPKQGNTQTQANLIDPRNKRRRQDSNGMENPWNKQNQRDALFSFARPTELSDSWPSLAATNVSPKQ